MPNLIRSGMQYSEQYRRFLTRLGYYDYQQGLIYRHLGQAEGWNSHLEKCRKYILNTVKLFKPAKVTVLGSGWLLDFPLAEISEMEIPVTLIDIVHPPDLISQVSSVKNVELIKTDITGGLINEIHRKAGGIEIFGRKKSLKDINIPVFRFSSDPGLVISLNILSQLDVLPVKYLRKRVKASENEINDFRMEIQGNHLEMLSEHRSVLISDTEEQIIERSGESGLIKTVIVDLPQGKQSEEWSWDFDLKGSDYYNKRSVLKVTAMVLGR